MIPEYLISFTERYKGFTIKLTLNDGRIAKGTLTPCPQHDKKDNKAYTVSTGKTMILFHASDVIYVFNKKRIRKKRRG